MFILLFTAMLFSSFSSQAMLTFPKPVNYKILITGPQEDIADGQDFVIVENLNPETGQITLFITPSTRCKITNAKAFLPEGVVSVEYKTATNDGPMIATFQSRFFGKHDPLEIISNSRKSRSSSFNPGVLKLSPSTGTTAATGAAAMQDSLGQTDSSKVKTPKTPSLGDAGSMGRPVKSHGDSTTSGADDSISTSAFSADYPPILADHLRRDEAAPTDGAAATGALNPLTLPPADDDKAISTDERTGKRTSGFSDDGSAVPSSSRPSTPTDQGCCRSFSDRMNQIIKSMYS